MKKLELKSSLATIGVLLIVLLLLGSCNKKEAPSAPTNLTAALMNNDCIHLSWKKVLHADYYRITVGFYKRDIMGFMLAETYEVSLGEVSGTVYDDRFPFEGTNYYKIEAVNEYGSSPCSEVSCDYPVSEEVFLLPNPATDNLFVETNNITRIIVVSFDGETLIDLEMNYDNNDIYALPLGQVDPGIYFIHIFSELGETVKRVVKL